jgi:hypothetical protein
LTQPGGGTRGGIDGAGVSHNALCLRKMHSILHDWRQAAAGKESLSHSFSCDVLTGVLSGYSLSLVDVPGRPLPYRLWPGRFNFNLTSSETIEANLAFVKNH